MTFLIDGTFSIAPNEFTESKDPNSTFSKTIDNTRRRAIRNLKKDWEIKYNRLSLTDYRTLETIYEKFEPVSFVNSDLDINTLVHVDITDQGYLAGNSNFFSDVTVNLTEE